MRNKIAKEMRRVIRDRHPDAKPEVQKMVYKEMKRIWKLTPRDQKNRVNVQ